MKVLVVDNAHLYKTPDGKYYTPSIYSYEFFNRYLNTFDEVRFVGKTKYVNNIDKSKYLLVSGDRLEIYELPWYQGIKGMLKQIVELIIKYRNVSDGCNCCIFRVAQIESYFAYIFCNKVEKPYAVEVVNDPATFVDMPKVFRWINIHLMSYIVRKANGVSYVTQEYLQKKYPSTARIHGESDIYFENYYSSIELMTKDLKSIKKYKDTKKQFEIIHVSNAINNNIKGHKTFIEALKIVSDAGYNISGCCIGDGQSVDEFKCYANKIGVGKKIEFIGRLHSKNEVINRLAKSDLLVLPTFMEGLPRTIIEAMAAGLPCLSTPVAGIPELLEKQYMFKPDDSKAFAKEIIHLIENPLELEEASRNNIEIAKRYTHEKLTERRNSFYCKLRNIVDKKHFVKN